MSKYQHVDFKTVEDFLGYLPEQELKIVTFLRSVVLDCIPDCTEKLSYNVPYYSRHSRICFIWPASIPWGNHTIKGVQFGFCYGYLLQDDVGFLNKGLRKQVFWKEYSTLKEIDVYLLKSFLYDAIAIDEQLKKEKK